MGDVTLRYFPQAGRAQLPLDVSLDGPDAPIGMQVCPTGCVRIAPRRAEHARGVVAQFKGNLAALSAAELATVRGSASPERAAVASVLSIGIFGLGP
jgi:hypothetical protein